MAKYRAIQTSFWSDAKVVDDFSPEDRYFYLYLLTNEKSNQLGCYELSIKQMCRDTGYNEETIKKLIVRFQEVLKVIYYDFETKEIFIKNWHKYNWLNSENTKKCIDKEFSLIKSEFLIDLISPLYVPYNPLPSNKKKKNNKKNNKNNNKNEKENNQYLVEPTAQPDRASEPEHERIGVVCEEIIGRLNKLTGSNFKSNADTNKNLIKALLKDYTKEDILMVVDKMCYKWMQPPKGGKDMSEYLRPSTLFRRSNFDNYYGIKVQEKEITTKDIAEQMDFSEFR